MPSPNTYQHTHALRKLSNKSIWFVWKNGIFCLNFLIELRDNVWYVVEFGFMFVRLNSDDMNGKECRFVRILCFDTKIQIFKLFVIKSRALLITNQWKGGYSPSTMRHISVWGIFCDLFLFKIGKRMFVLMFIVFC